jgi:hypothetical protein
VRERRHRAGKSVWRLFDPLVNEAISHQRSARTSFQIRPLKADG